VIASLAPRAFSVFERNLFVYRRQWAIIVTGFFEPLFFLLGIGYGVGQWLIVALPGILRSASAAIPAG
jgi:hypothetical protein